jgi:ABC-type hemin transport system ATPase subunit
MEGIEDHVFGAVDDVMTEAHLTRLYDIPIRQVALPENAGPCVVPVFSS